MPLRLATGGRQVRTDHLTLEQFLTLEQRTGKPWRDLNPYVSARDALALAMVLLESAGDVAATAEQLPGDDIASWLTAVEDDLPDAFMDGVPKLGGCSFDDYVVVFASEPWCWPPDVTRRQRVRDLDLLLEAAKSRPKRRHA